jgi:hypothetical protein
MNFEEALRGMRKGQLAFRPGWKFSIRCVGGHNIVTVPNDEKDAENYGGTWDPDASSLLEGDWQVRFETFGIKKAIHRALEGVFVKRMNMTGYVMFDASRGLVRVQKSNVVPYVFTPEDVAKEDWRDSDT